MQARLRMSGGEWRRLMAAADGQTNSNGESRQLQAQGSNSATG